MSDEQDSCPICGALPCDWVDNPHARPSATFLDNLGYILMYHAADDPADVWKRIVAALTEQPHSADLGIPIYASRDATEEVLGGEEE